MGLVLHRESRDDFTITPLDLEVGTVAEAKTGFYRGELLTEAKTGFYRGELLMRCSGNRFVLLRDGSFWSEVCNEHWLSTVRVKVLPPGTKLVTN